MVLFDNVEIWDIYIRDSSIFNRYIIIVNIYSNINNLHITCTSSTLLIFWQMITITVVSQETNFFFKFHVKFFFHSLA